MLTLHRLHLKVCPFRVKGWNYTLCNCPIWADGKLNGERFKRSLGTNQWDRALRRVEILERGGELVPVLPSGPSLQRAVQAFLEACRGRHLRDSTVDSYQKTLEHLTDALGTAPVAGIDISTLDRYRAGRKIASTTWRKELETLRAFFAWCLERKWVSENPAKKLKMPRTEELTTLPFTQEELAKLLAAADRISSDDTAETPYIRKRARALVLTLIYSGLRISDVTRLRRSALDPKSRYITLKVLKTGVPQKIQIKQEAVDALTSLPAVSTEYFFWTGRGDPMTCTKNLRRTVQRLGILAGVHAHPHRFRDTFAVQLLTNGADIRTVQKLLGHHSVRTTEAHYAHFVAAHQALLDAATATLDFQPKPARPLLMKTRKNRSRNP